MVKLLICRNFIKLPHCLNSVKLLNYRNFLKFQNDHLVKLPKFRNRAINQATHHNPRRIHRNYTYQNWFFIHKRLIKIFHCLFFKFPDLFQNQTLFLQLLLVHFFFQDQSNFSKNLKSCKPFWAKKKKKHKTLRKGSYNPGVRYLMREAVTVAAKMRDDRRDSRARHESENSLVKACHKSLV